MKSAPTHSSHASWGRRRSAAATTNSLSSQRRLTVSRGVRRFAYSPARDRANAGRRRPLRSPRRDRPRSVSLGQLRRARTSASLHPRSAKYKRARKSKFLSINSSARTCHLMLMFRLGILVPHFCFRLALVMGLALPLAGRPAEYSALWGRNGEAWTPQSRLLDFSWAGYHCGDCALPTLPPGVNVKNFGAKGDGVTDDLKAFSRRWPRSRGAQLKCRPEATG